MTNIPFHLPDEDGVIIVTAHIEDRYRLRLALDTAASHTTVDANVLLMLGYNLQNPKGQSFVETSNGVIPVEDHLLKKLTCLDIERTDFVIQVYDFLAHGVTSDYDGVLGIDFLKGRKICIDFVNGIITIN
jgi:hypothetical protein